MYYIYWLRKKNQNRMNLEKKTARIQILKIKNGK